MKAIDSYSVSENSKGEISLKLKFIGFESRDEAIDAIERIGAYLLEDAGQGTLEDVAQPETLAAGGQLQ